MNLYIYDLETYPNCFTFTGKFYGKQEVFVFEISSRMNERDSLLSHLNFLRNHPDLFMVGYNSLNFDWPIVQKLLNEPFTFTAQTAYLEAQKIFAFEYGQNPHAIRVQDRLIPQIDLVKINHFDNANRHTSLKALQFAMRSESVEDLPFDIRDLTPDEMDLLKKYNLHDVTETERFTGKCMHLIEMRHELMKDGVLFGDVMNFNDVKIGVEYLVKKIGRNKCYNGSKPKQTFRSEIHFSQIILPKIKYYTPEFEAVKDWFSKVIVYPAQKEAKKPSLTAKLAGLDFEFGLGGVHASVERQHFKANDEYAIIDIDVSGMYVAVAIANGFHPQHLGQDYVTAYKQLQTDRARYKKGTVMNLVLKLAGNGVYGKSNSIYSVFYDPQYTYSVTVNGQLQLIQLAEVLSFVPGLKLIQANTDGITAYVPRRYLQWFALWKSQWERETGLKLEEVEYTDMWIRDVNNYIARDTKGNIKRKGAYWYPIVDSDYHGSSGTNWNKDFSNIASIKAAERVMLDGCSVEDAILCVSDKFDFMLRYKTPGKAKVFIGDQKQLRTVRYIVSHNGSEMRKVAPSPGPLGQYKRKPGVTLLEYNAFTEANGPDVHSETVHTKNKSRYTDVETRIESGRLITQCNHINNFNWRDLDYSYYVDEARKLIIN